MRGDTGVELIKLKISKSSPIAEGRAPPDGALGNPNELCCQARVKV